MPAGFYVAEFEIARTFAHEIRRTVTDMDNMPFSSLTWPERGTALGSPAPSR